MHPTEREESERERHPEPQSGHPRRRRATPEDHRHQQARAHVGRPVALQIDAGERHRCRQDGPQDGRRVPPPILAARPHGHKMERRRDAERDAGGVAAREAVELHATNRELRPDHMNDVGARSCTQKRRAGGRARATRARATYPARTASATRAQTGRPAKPCTALQAIAREPNLRDARGEVRLGDAVPKLWGVATRFKNRSTTSRGPGTSSGFGRRRLRRASPASRTKGEAGGEPRPSPAMPACSRRDRPHR